jgi:hypothetical protein
MGPAGAQSLGKGLKARSIRQQLEHARIRLAPVTTGRQTS